MSGIKCAFVHPYPTMGDGGKCGRYISHTRALAGQKLCSVHDPACREMTRTTHLARQSRRAKQGFEPPSPQRTCRASTIAAIKELEIYWDGPGSEGREV